MRRVEDLRRTLKAIQNPLSGHYAIMRMPVNLRLMETVCLGYGSERIAALRRQEFYRKVGMRVRMREGGELEITLGVRKLGSASGSTATGTMYPNPPPTASWPP